MSLRVNFCDVTLCVRRALQTSSPDTISADGSPGEAQVKQLPFGLKTRAWAPEIGFRCWLGWWSLFGCNKTSNSCNIFDVRSCVGIVDEMWPTSSEFTVEADRWEISPRGWRHLERGGGENPFRGSVGRFSCNTWEDTRVTCDMALQAGNQFHSFRHFWESLLFPRYFLPFTNGISFTQEIFPCKKKQTNKAEVWTSHFCRGKKFQHRFPGWNATSHVAREHVARGRHTCCN